MRKIFNNGYTLLFAVITAVLVLSVTSFILGVSRKQYILTSTAKDSNIAFYNADSGVECVFQSFNENFDLSAGGAFTCNNQNYTIPAMPIGETNSTTYTWTSDMASPIAIPFETGCALVKLKQGYLNVGSKQTPLYKIRILIESYGYNQCSQSGSTYIPKISPRTVERAETLMYSP